MLICKSGLDLPNSIFLALSYLFIFLKGEEFPIFYVEFFNKTVFLLSKLELPKSGEFSAKILSLCTNFYG